MLYSEKVMDHFTNPRNVGEMPDASCMGEVGNAKCGDIMRIYLKINNDGVITGINVGGANFSETAGLGAKTKEPAFTEQFKGLSSPLTLKGNVDSVSGASVSSGAIVNGVNAVLDYVAGLEK